MCISFNYERLNKNYSSVSYSYSLIPPKILMFSPSPFFELLPKNIVLEISSPLSERGGENHEKLTSAILGIFSEFLIICNNSIPAGNYMFKVNNRNTRTKCELCSKLTIQVNAGWQNMRNKENICQYCAR